MVKCYQMGCFYDERWPDDFYSNLSIVDTSKELSEEFLDELAYRIKRGQSIKRTLDIKCKAGRYSAKFIRTGGFTKVILSRQSPFSLFFEEVKDVAEYCIAKIDTENGALD